MFKQLVFYFALMNQVLNSVAARSQVREFQAKSNQTATSVDDPESLRSPRRTNGLSAAGEADHQLGSRAALENATLAPNHVADSPTASGVPEIRSTGGMSSTEIASDALQAVLDQLATATVKLKQANSVETSRDLCQLIRDCADAALSLKRLLNASSG
jgi:hypothetical protein